MILEYARDLRRSIREILPFLRKPWTDNTHESAAQYQAHQQVQITTYFALHRKRKSESKGTLYSVSVVVVVARSQCYTASRTERHVCSHSVLVYSTQPFSNFGVLRRFEGLRSGSQAVCMTQMVQCDVAASWHMRN